jgi:hypothetical protein
MKLGYSRTTIEVRTRRTGNSPEEIEAFVCLEHWEMEITTSFKETRADRDKASIPARSSNF